MKKAISALFFAFLAATIFALPSGYHDINLGMDVDSVKKALKDDIDFGYRGERDVSLSPGTDQVLIETDGVFAGFSFLSRCYFQFDDGKLSTITINMNRDKIDHYSIYKKLCEKYGEPDSVTPEKIQWQDDNVIFSLERPLSLKYIDKKVFEKKLKGSMIQKSTAEQARDEFLEKL